MTPEPDLPFSGKTPTSKHASYLGAVEATPDRQRKAAIYRRFVTERGFVTDGDAVRELGWPINVVCSTRNAFVDRGEMTCDGLRDVQVCIRGQWRARKHSLWRLTTAEEKTLRQAAQQALRNTLT